MAMSVPDPPEVVVTSVSFGDDTVEVTYAERREQSEQVGVLRSMLIARELVEDEVEELLDAARAIVDRGWVAIRNPPDRVG